MTSNDDGGVKAMDLELVADAGAKPALVHKDKKAEARWNQLPWVEKYRPDRYDK